jgi:hypothetical protein
VPAVTRGDAHRVDIFARQQVTKIVVGRTATVEAASSLLGVRLFYRLCGILAAPGIDVADRNHLSFRILRERSAMPRSHRPDADAPHRDAIARCHGPISAQGAGRHNRSRNRNRTGTFDKRSAIAAPIGLLFHQFLVLSGVGAFFSVLTKV